MERAKHITFTDKILSYEFMVAVAMIGVIARNLQFGFAGADG